MILEALTVAANESDLSLRLYGHDRHLVFVEVDMLNAEVDSSCRLRCVVFDKVSDGASSAASNFNECFVLQSFESTNILKQVVIHLNLHCVLVGFKLALINT